MQKRPIKSPAAPTAPARRGWRPWLRGLLCAGLFAGGALLMADWLHERGTLGDVAVESAGETGEFAAAPVPRMLPNMDAHLDRQVAFGPVRGVSFGESRALMSTGSSEEGPEAVFTRVLLRRRGGIDETAVRTFVRGGPSAQKALRLQATVGRFESGAFLLSLTPDTEAMRDGGLVFEPGAVTLAFRTASGWDYVAFFFPDGLDLSSLGDAAEVPRSVLDDLGADVSSILEPRLRIPLDGLPGPLEEQPGGIILCRVREGTAGSAVARVAGRLESRGWRPLAMSGEEEVLCILQRPPREVWLSAPEAAQEGGVVTVVIRTP